MNTDSPNQAATFNERFIGSYRRDLLDAWLFIDVDQVREETEHWV